VGRKEEERLFTGPQALVSSSVGQEKGGKKIRGKGKKGGRKKRGGEEEKRARLRTYRNEGKHRPGKKGRRKGGGYCGTV